MNFKKLKGKFKITNFIMLTFAGIINAFAIAIFLAPAKLYDGGFSGLSMFIDFITPEYLTIPIFLLIFNVPVFLYGLKKQGLPFTVYSIYTVLIYSLSVWLFSQVIPFDFSNGSPIAKDDLLLSAFFGGLISGVGSGFTIRFGGAIDGIEVLGVTFARRIGISVGTFVMIFNVFVYVLAGIVMKNWILPLYSILAYAVGLKTVDFIVEGFDHVKSAIIITAKSDALCAILSEEFSKGITVINAKGYFSNEEKSVIYFVVNRYQIEKMKRIVKAIDPDAFVSISEVTYTSSLKNKFHFPKRKNKKNAIEK